MNKKLNGKWALITGSSKGIGQQIAVGLARYGCNIVIHGRKLENNKNTKELLEKLGVKTISVAGELSNFNDVDNIINMIFKEINGVDILYNNAGVMSIPDLVWNIPMEEWMRVFQINLFAVVRLCNAFAPEMKKRGFGRIINLSSGIKDQPDHTPYSVSKAAIDKYTRDLAYELKDDNVLVNYLDPGWLRTNLGGPNAPNDVETVLPGALVPALLEDNGPTGRSFNAQDYKYLSDYNL